jgi:hypothetical protein
LPLSQNRPNFSAMNDTVSPFENPFEALERRRIARDQERQRIMRRVAELNAEGEKDAITREVLQSLYPSGFPKAFIPAREPDTADPAVPDGFEPAPLPPETAAHKQATRGGEMTVKEMAVAVLQKAYPEGLSATQIKARAFLRFQKHINPNTLTVSLVRAKPRVKCDGRTWYYVKTVNGVVADSGNSRPEAPGLL